MRLRYLQCPDPCRRNLLRRMAAPSFAFLPLDHPLARRCVDPPPPRLAPAAPAHLIRPPVDRDLAPLRHLPPPLSLPQVARHPFQLPLFRFLLAPIGPRRCGQLRVRREPALPPHGGVLLPLHPRHPLQFLLPGRIVRTAFGLRPPVHRPIGPFHLGILRGATGRVVDGRDPQPNKPQHERRGQIVAGSPRRPVVHPQPLGPPPAFKEAPQDRLHGTDRHVRPAIQGKKAPTPAPRRWLRPLPIARWCPFHRRGASAPWHPSATPDALPSRGSSPPRVVSRAPAGARRPETTAGSPAPGAPRWGQTARPTGGGSARRPRKGAPASVPRRRRGRPAAPWALWDRNGRNGCAAPPSPPADSGATSDAPCDTAPSRRRQSPSTTRPAGGAQPSVRAGRAARPVACASSSAGVEGGRRSFVQRITPARSAQLRDAWPSQLSAA